MTEEFVYIPQGGNTIYLFFSIGTETQVTYKKSNYTHVEEEPPLPIVTYTDG